MTLYPLRKRRAAPMRPRSLGARLVLILIAVGLAGSAAITVLLATVITPSFGRLEANVIDGHVDRTRAVLVEYASKVESAVRDYGDWNDSYDYMAHQTRAFEDESFSRLAMRNLGVDGMAYVANDGHVVIARWLGPNGADQPAMRAALLASIGHTAFGTVLKHGSSASYYARLGREVAAIGVARVRRSDGSGAPRGYVLMARRLTSAQLAQLLQLNAHLDLATSVDGPDVTTRRRTMTIAVPIPGADGHSVASAAFTVRRDVSLLGQRMLLFAVAGSTLLFLIVLLAVRLMVARQVLRPLHRVERHMQVVTASGSLGLLAEEGRRDEIGSLNRSFNTMLSQLKDLRQQLEVQSFALGRSESAVAVMHNVRNALNPISTILSQGVAEQPGIDRAVLDRATAELARDDVPAARRQKLAAFVAAATEAEATARADRRRQLQIGREAMQTVLEIIGQQQQAAHERPPLETCDVSEIAAQNATIARYSGETSIAFSFPAAACMVRANRLLLSQVIGNLFANAAEAIAATGGHSGSIMVTIAHRGPNVDLSIRDDGEGFDGETGASLFQRGFSTRSHKSGGLGLHWCANSMVAMEGALRLESEGRGRGAVAILTLKAAEEATQDLAA